MPWKHDLSADINTLLNHGFYTFDLTKEIIDLGITGALGFCMVLSTGYYTYSPIGIQIVFGAFGDVILYRNFYPDEYNENTFGQWRKIITTL